MLLCVFVCGGFGVSVTTEIGSGMHSGEWNTRRLINSPVSIQDPASITYLHDTHHCINNISSPHPQFLDTIVHYFHHPKRWVDETT